MNRFESHGPRGPGRTRRAIEAIAKTAGLAIVFAAAAGGGALLHLDLGAPRRFATARANAILESMFQGRIVVERAGTLHLNRLAGIDAHVLDPDDPLGAVPPQDLVPQPELDRPAFERLAAGAVVRVPLQPDRRRPDGLLPRLNVVLGLLGVGQ